jgi:hypothetical protein
VQIDRVVIDALRDAHRVWCEELEKALGIAARAGAVAERQACLAIAEAEAARYHELGLGSIDTVIRREQRIAEMIYADFAERIRQRSR